MQAYLFERYQKPIYGYFMKVLNNCADAEDATQVTISRLLKYRKSYSGERKFSSWLFSIAVSQGNRALNQRLKESSQQTVEMDTLELRDMSELIVPENGSHLLSAAQTRDAIKKAIVSLPQAPRELLSLFQLCLKQSERKLQFMLLSMLKDRDIKQAS